MEVALEAIGALKETRNSAGREVTKVSIKKISTFFVVYSKGICSHFLLTITYI